MPVSAADVFVLCVAAAVDGDPKDDEYLKENEPGAERYSKMKA